MDVWEVGPLTHKARHTSEDVHSELEKPYHSLIYLIVEIGGGNTAMYFKKLFIKIYMLSSRKKCIIFSNCEKMSTNL